MIAKFTLGEIVVTPRVEDALARAGARLDDLLARHETGDWGDVSDEQWGLNELSLLEGLNIVSTYALPQGDLVSVFTRADRSHTLVHLAPAVGHAVETRGAGASVRT